MPGRKFGIQHRLTMRSRLAGRNGPGRETRLGFSLASVFTLRRAELRDLDVLVEMRIALLREVGNLSGDSSQSELRSLVEAHRNYFSSNLATGQYFGFAAEVEDRIVGTGGLVLLARPPYKGNLTGLEGYLMNVYTVPEWRRKGIATALVQQILAAAKRSGVKRVWLHAEPDAKRIYEAAGFVSKSAEMEMLL